MLMRRGRQRVKALVGGIHGWQKLGYPLEGSRPEVRLKAA